MMARWWKSVRRVGTAGRKQPARRTHLALERLEERSLLDAAPAQHVLILSVDGLHQADVTDPNLAAYETNIHNLQQAGVSYTNASTSKPSDSFPGTLAYLTGAGPATTGVFYDDSYSRALYPPGTTLAQIKAGTVQPGTEAQFAENIDYNSAYLGGGNAAGGEGNAGVSSIDPSQLPVDSSGNPVYPNQFLPVNTIFDVAHQAGLYTAFSDKHPAYQIADGTDPNAINDFYSPEINSTTALYDPATGKTVDANALLKANPFTDVSKYVLVDPKTDPMGPNDPNLINDTTHNLLLTEKYDDLKVQAILNEINGRTARNDASAPVPNLFGMNFQAVSVAQKYASGGIVLLPDGSTAPSAVLEAAIEHTDASIGKIVSALENTQGASGASLWNSTDLILTAKHGQSPRVNPAGLAADSTLPNLLNKAGDNVAFAVQDDVSLIYLQDQSKTADAVGQLDNFRKTGTIDVYFQGTKTTLPASKVINQILADTPNADASRSTYTRLFGNPSKDATTPDIIVTLKPGYIWVGNPLNFNFKRAEHGGFNLNAPDDNTHVPLIVTGGALSPKVRGTAVKTPVDTRQIAVTALDALGLDPRKLQGAVIEGTQALPGTGIPGSGGKHRQGGGEDDQGSDRRETFLGNPDSRQDAGQPAGQDSDSVLVRAIERLANQLGSVGAANLGHGSQGAGRFDALVTGLAGKGGRRTGGDSDSNR